MRTPPDKRIVMTLYSAQVADPSLRWKAKVVFEPGSTDDSPVVINVMTREEEPIPEGVLEFLGRRLPVKDGRTEVTCRDFIAGKHARAVWLHRKGLQSVDGGLTFE